MIDHQSSIDSLFRRLALASLLLFTLCFSLPAVADSDSGELILPGLDPLIGATRDARLLGVERLILRERILMQGPDPVDGAGLPDYDARMRHFFITRSGVDLERMVTVVEPSSKYGLESEFRYPKYHFLFQPQQTLPGGFIYYPPRNVDAGEVDLFIDDINVAFMRRLAVVNVLNRHESLNAYGMGGSARVDDGLINLTIPIKIPRTLEKIIGRGEKTSIRISGREHISISGESRRSNRFVQSERRQNQSWFPTLDMEQQLQINLSGQIGERIMLEVDHNSQVIGPDATKIRLTFEGGEDDVIRSIETGDVGLTLPGSQLLGYSSNKSGLFGIKTEGQVGPAEFTIVASKQKAESASKSFNSKGGSVSEHVIEAYRYLNNRFFRLDLPQGMGHDVPDIPGRAVGDDEIDQNSVQVFKFIGAGLQQIGDIRNIVAIPDRSGIWNPVVVQAAIDESQAGLQYGELWRPVPFEMLLDQDANLVAIDLKYETEITGLLAVTYDIIHSDGSRTRIGDKPGEDDDERLSHEDELYYKMKLLKPQNPEAFTWQYVLRNIYPLGGSNIDPSTFDLRIEINRFTDFPHQDLSADGTEGSGLDWFRIFGLDEEDQQSNDGSDSIVDKHRTLIFDYQRGLLKFPLDFPEPFNAPPDKYTDYADLPDFDFEHSLLAENLIPQIYDWETNQNLLSTFTQFRLIASHAAASSSFNLGVSNIEEGSESVTLDGRTLNRGTDYEIDYIFGEVTLKGDAAASMSPDSQIGVNYQYAPFLGGGNSSLLGFNLSYAMGQNSRMSTTWLYESNQVVGHKAKLGEEPSRTLVGNVNGQFMLKPRILTNVANILSRRDTDRESSVRVSGEYAISVPNPNTFNEVFVEDFEGVDSSDLMPVSRLSWNASSSPVHRTGLQLLPGDPRYPDYAYLHDHDYTEELRLDTRWFLPKDNTLRRHLNPELKEAEAREAQQVLQIHMSSGTDEWTGDNWGGVMRGLGKTGVDLTKAQFLEFWVNDYRHMTLGSEPSGTLHFDFGYISEDFYWPVHNDTLEVGTFQREDGILPNTDPNGLWIDEEDVGLGNDPIRDLFDVEYGSSGDPYPKINGTYDNKREDTEDLNGNTTFDRQNGFYTISINLADSALVDVLRDYPADDVDDNLEHNLAWRKYRIRLSDAVPITPVGGATPYLGSVTHMRIWFEDENPEMGQTARNLQFSEIKFLGSRWEREGIRKVPVPEAPEEQLLNDTDLPAGDVFFIGEVNNKENPDYTPPFSLHVENKIPEKETSLVIDYQNLDYQHMVRASRVISTRGEDFTRYGRLVFYVYNPRYEQADMEVFYRVGADTLNFYEINYRFDASSGTRTGWREITLDMAELSNAKLADRDPVSGWIETRIDDDLVDRSYKVRVVGAPDLRRVKRIYLGVRNTDQTTPTSGYFYFNDVRLREVKRDVGHAERVALSVSMADVVKMDFDWARRDADFHGLNQTAGQGYTNEDWNFSASFKIDDFIPLLGFRMPVSYGKQNGETRPKYLTNSDIEIIDDVLRDEQSSQNSRENFSVRMSHAPSSNFFLRYLLDPWALSFSGSRNESNSPLTVRDGDSWQGAVAYDLNLRNKAKLGDYGVLGSVPILKSLSLLPSKISVSARFSGATSRVANYNVIDEAYIDRPETETKAGSITGTMNYKPLPIADIGLSLRSDRDMFRRNDLLGFNIGAETVYAHQVQVRFQTPNTLGLPKHWLFKPLNVTFSEFKKLRPSVDYNSSFTNDHSLNVMQAGDPPGTRNLQNSGDWSIRASIPINDTIHKLLPKKSGMSDQERQQRLREEERRTQRGARQGGGEQQTFDDPRLNNPDLTPEERQALYDELVIERSLQEDEDRSQRNADELDEPEEGGFSLPNPLTPVLAFLRGIDPVQVNYTNNRSGNYGRFTNTAPFWYQMGFIQAIDEPDSVYVSHSEREKHNLSLSTTSKVSRAVSVDMKFKKSSGTNTGVATKTWSYEQEWPDINVSMTGLEQLGFMGRGDGFIRQAGMQLSYKYTRSVPSYTVVSYNPRDSRVLAPRLNLTLQSGMSLSLNISSGEIRNMTGGSLAVTNRFNTNVQIRHTFRAEGLLAKLGLYRPGIQPTVNMDMNITYNKDATMRWNPGMDFGGEPVTQIGNSSISVNPRFSYQITRNLSGAFRLIYSRNMVEETDSVTTTFGIGMEATFVF